MSIIKAGLSLASTGLKGALGWAGGAKVWLIVLALSVASAGALGWYKGSTHEAAIYAQAATQAAEKARTAQFEKDARDWAAAKEDYEARLHIAQGANDALATLLAKKPRLVPNPTKAFAPLEAMRALNDPKLVGDTE